MAPTRSRTDAAQAQVETVLAADHKLSPANVGTTLRVLNQTKLLSTSNQSNRIFTTLLGVVAAISLVVGGIGVMNIMLVTGTETDPRDRHPQGHRRPPARHPRSVSRRGRPHHPRRRPARRRPGLVGSRIQIIGVTPVVVVVVGLFFGLYPANRAASLRPIDALRHE